MSFDWSISLGAVVVAVSNLIGLLISGVALYYKTREWVLKLHTDNKMELSAIKERMVGMESRVESIWEWFTTRLERRNGS